MGNDLEQILHWSDFLGSEQTQEVYSERENLKIRRQEIMGLPQTQHHRRIEIVTTNRKRIKSKGRKEEAWRFRWNLEEIQWVRWEWGQGWGGWWE